MTESKFEKLVPDHLHIVALHREAPVSIPWETPEDRNSAFCNISCRTNVINPNSIQTLGIPGQPHIARVEGFLRLNSDPITLHCLDDLPDSCAPFSEMAYKEQLRYDGVSPNAPLIVNSVQEVQAYQDASGHQGLDNDYLLLDTFDIERLVQKLRNVGLMDVHVLLNDGYDPVASPPQSFAKIVIPALGATIEMVNKYETIVDTQDDAACEILGDVVNSLLVTV